MTNRFPCFPRPALASIFALGLGFATPALAATDNYLGTGTSSWNNPANWSLGVPAGANDTAVFNSPVNTAAETVTLDANQAALGIQLPSTEGALTISSTAASVNASGFTLTLGTGGITNAGAGDITLNANVVLNGTQTWSGTKSIILNNALTGTGNLTISTPNINFGGSLVGNVTGTALFSGTGNVSGNFLNTFSGGVTINNGTIGVAGAAVNDTHNLTFQQNTNYYSNGVSQTYSGSVFGGVAGAGASMNNIGAGNMTFSGTTDNTGLSVSTLGGTTLLAKTSSATVHAIGGNLTLASNSTTQLAGTGGDQIINTGNVTMSNAGATFDLNGNSETINTLTGSNATAVIKNTLATTTGTLTIGANNGGATFDGIIQDGGGATALTKLGTGTETLRNNNTFTGGTTINAGTLVLDFTNATIAPTSILSASSPLALGGGTLSIKGTATGTTNQTVNGTTFNPGASIATINSNAGTATNLALGAITRNTGSTVNFVLPAAGVISTTTANSNFAGGQQTILGGYATVGGTGWAVSGSGATPGNITALTTYNAGFAAGTDVDVATGISTPAAMTVNSVRFNTAGTATVNTAGNLVIATGGILQTTTVGNNATLINNNSITSGNGKDLIVIQNNTSANGILTIGSDIVNNGSTSIGFTKSGAGAVSLTGGNTYTGPTQLNAGTTSVANTSSLGSGSAVNLKGTSTLAFTNLGGQIDLVGIGAIATASSAVQPAQNAIDGNIGTRWESDRSDPQYIRIDLGTVYNLSGASISFETAGAQDFVIQTGSPAAANFAPDGTNSNGYTTVSTTTGQASYTDNHFINYSFTAGASGQFVDLYGTARNTPYGYSINEFQLFQAVGPVTQTIGSLSGEAGTSVTLGTTLTLATGGDNTSTTFAGVISGTGNLTKIGSGTMTITGINTFTGAATVSGGTLRAAGTSAIKTLNTITQLTLNKTGTLLLGASNQIKAAIPVTIGGGVGVATLNTGGFSQSGASALGALTLAGTGAVDFSTTAPANGNSIVAFADSSAITWSGMLSIYNYAGSTSGGGTDQLIFGTSSSALTPTQLGDIAFYSGGMGSTFLGYGMFVGTMGEVSYSGTPVPEPATVFAGLLMVGAAGWSQRRKLCAFAGVRRG